MQNHRLESRLKGIIDEMIEEVNNAEVTIDSRDTYISELESRIEELEDTISELKENRNGSN